ncbi:O-methyltransferase [Cesiribacter andamanensis]|uniref:Putative O-methyltransferase n=1 Tax=Cesiribacter andamanensis AMV16 TaxID=1279009 RepID=M7NYF2_9BACT|nr:O-methyltransferase [Cesiribacter andamanensis]EMR03414.1 Putative O-methyltransferase [Cesiribacter andamanensis AMV16]
MEFLDKDVQAYAEDHSSPEPALLQQINRDTHAYVLMPRMLSGHLQGRLLAMLAQMIRPRAVLEIGTYTGYSALCMAEGLAPEGELHTIDINEELESRVRGYFARSPQAAQIHYHIGNALEVVPQLQLPWELVFIDADKRNYAAYYQLVIGQMAPGGFLIADNVLWSGKVTNPQASDKDTEALRLFNRMIQEDTRVENVLLPVRDGLMIIRKK